MADSVAVPKKQSTDSFAPDDAAPPRGLAGWQATGLALAVICIAATRGLGPLLGAAIFAPVIYALVRLRANAPDATSTAGLVAAGLGPRAGAFTGILQLIGYALLAITSAQTVGAVIAAKTVGYPDLVDTWPWPLYTASAIIVAALLVNVLVSRVLAALAGLFAVAGLLIYFYLGLAVSARFLSGESPVMGGPVISPPSIDVLASLAVLALGLVGFEAVTTRTQQLHAGGRSMGWAVGLAALVAVVVWFANHLGGTGDLQVSSSDFSFMVSELYGPAGDTLLLAGGLALSAAGLLALTWAAAGVLDRYDGAIPSEAAFGAVVVALMIVGVVLTRLGMTPGYVGGLVLLAAYGLILAAYARTSSSGPWWPILMAVPLIALVLVQLVSAGLSTSELEPEIIAVLLIAAAAVAATVGTRRRPD